MLDWLKSIFQNKTKENVFAFTCGDIVCFHVLGVPPEVSVLVDKMFTTIILAAAGGAAGWAGKELLIWLWKQIRLWIRAIRRRKRRKRLNKKP